MIACNVYGTVEAPKDRGFSYIEVWMIGIQIPILLALFEYALILALNRNVNGIRKLTIVQAFATKRQEAQIERNELNIELMDRYTEIGSAIFFIIFNICSWMIVALK